MSYRPTYAPEPPYKPYRDHDDEDAYLNAGLPPPKGAGAIRIRRKDYQGNLWTKGSRGRCICRFCCCTFLIGIFLIVSIVLALLIWIRPPDIQINSVALPVSGSPFKVTASSLNLYLGVNISVSNPNYFQIDLPKVKADLTYPINNLDVGGGEKDNTVFKSNSETMFTFPFTITYNEQDDPNKTVLEDILSRCGITGQKRDLDINYKITLGIKVFFVTVSPTFSSSFSFECPVDANSLQALLNGAGITIPGVPPL